MLLCFFVSSCWAWDSTWSLDGRFSFKLIFNYASSTNAVDAIQIYKTEVNKEHDHILPLHTLRQMSLIYETREKEDIVNFFKLFTPFLDPPLKEECSRKNRKEVYHVIAFDHTMLRVGYFRYYPCSGGNYGVVRPLDDDGLFQNTKLPSFFNELKNR